MAKKVLSIAIGTECTKICEVTYKKNYKNKGIRVYRSASFPTPPNTIEDGYIRDKAAFGDELKNRLKAGKFKSDKVIFSVTSSKIANREVILPPVKEKRIMEIIKTGAAEYFPIDMKEYILSYLILEKNTSDRKAKARQKKLDKKERKLVKKLEKKNRKALKKKSKTEIIADNMELMEAKQREQFPEETISDNKNDNSTDNTKKSMRLSVFAAPSTLVKNYYSFAKQMHLDIVAIDYSGNSSYQAIKRQAKRGTNVFVQMNEKDSLITILREDVLVLQRTVNYGLSTIVESIMEQEYYHVNSHEEAIELLHTRNLLSLDAETMDNLKLDSSWSKGEVAAASEFVRSLNTSEDYRHDRERQARQSIRESMHFLSNSIARMLDYYKSSHKQIDIETIYLTGAGVHIQGIENFFTTEIGITHKIMEKLATYSSKKKAATYRNNPSNFLTCIGAVIKPVDFIPLEFTLKKQKRSAVIGTIIFTMACLAGSAGTVYVSLTDYLEAKQELDQVEEQFHALPALSGVHEEYETVLKELDNLQELESKTKSNNDNIKNVITELESKLPKGTVIHSMQFTENDVTMSVTASDSKTGPNALIAVILKQLKTIEYFKENVQVSGITVSEENGSAMVSFTILCTYAE